MKLSATQPIGTGRHRMCFVHPNNPAQCIKILFNKESGGEKEVKRELAYYQHLQARGIDWSGLPKYLGSIDTDMGVGHIFDFICDGDGSPSKALSDYLESASSEEIAPKLIPCWKT